MAQGGGYMASLGVYHELHCLVSSSHHCIEAIRLSLMCAGNPGLYSFKWGNSTRKPKTKTNSARTCVDWEALDGWARKRGVGMRPRLKRPQQVD
ncbi:hypothetical protein K432DRAFT_450040 [Lepidopterella palustris CBS 459.81]|uniref:Uncharacterized protein n=1 Tax=Lepidopterella palustris CBS 459.81 TaxID=1314670 RepID=A0A8E2ECZ1_9PEZI|nr:hypothetical protein K432DRAFT_450040 [Lepidopterella palustris CBS 459.81]